MWAEVKHAVEKDIKALGVGEVEECMNEEFNRTTENVCPSWIKGVGNLQ
jgi:hypothetical protein